MPKDQTPASAPTPQRPVILYDGDCGFCRRSVLMARRLTGGRVDFVASQSDECAARFPQIPRSALDESVHLVETDGRVTRGAEAVVRALATNPWWRAPAAIYKRSRLASAAMERAYGFVARHRHWFSRVTRPFLPDDSRPGAG